MVIAPTNTQTVATVPQGTQVVANGTNLNQAGYNGNPYSTPNVTPTDTTAKTTPIISANQAIDHYLGAKLFLDQTQQGITTQAQNNAQNQPQTIQNQPKDDPNAISQIPTADLAAFRQANPGLPFTQADLQKYKQTQISSQADNTDLTNALNGATTALNAGNGITPPDKTAYQTTEDKLNTQETDIQGKLDKINTQISDSSDQFQQTVSQIQQGTFPLTPTQQALLTQTQSAVEALNQSAQQTAKLYAEAGKTFGAVHGLSQFNPGATQQAISAAMVKGQAEIAKAEMDGVKQLADLQKGFQTDDFNMISKSYDALQKSLDAKQKILSDLSTKVQKMADDATTQYDKEVTQYNTEVQNAINNAFKSQTLTDTEKKNLFDETMSSANFTEKQKQDATDNYYKGITASQNATRIGIEQQNANTALLKLQQDTLTNSNPIVQSVADNVQTTMSGKKYFDPSAYTGKDKTTAMNAADSLGVPIINDKNDAKALQSIDQVRQNNQTISDYLKDILPKDAVGRILATPGTKLSQFLQTDDKKAAFGSFSTSAIAALNALKGSGSIRITQKEIDLALANDIPSLTDTVGTANQKLQNITSLLNNSENAILIKDRSTLPGGTNATKPTIPDAPKGEINVVDKATGQVGHIPVSEYDVTKYSKYQP